MSKKGQVEMGTETITIRHDFTEKELQAKSQSLAEACKKREEFEDDKKKVMSEYKFKIDTLNAEINLTANHVAQKYYMKRVETELVLDFDAKRRLYMLDGEVKHSEPLRDEDWQLKTAAR